MYNVKPHLNEVLYHYFKNKELDELYISVAIKSFAESFISIFVPIYLLTLGFSLRDIALYYLVYYGSVSFLMPFCMILNAKIGIKKVMTAGTIVLVCYYFLLNFLQSGMPYVAVALAFGLSVALYYSSYHVEFTKYSDKKEEATDTSILMIIALAATTLGPIVGSIFISELSFTFLFFMVSVLLIFSVFPLFFTKDRKIKRPDFSLKGILKADSRDKAVAYQASGVLGVVSGVFWPVFIYLSLKSMLSLGVIVSLTSVFMIIFLFIIGRLSDDHKEKVLGVGIFSHSLSWLSRMLFLSPVGILFSNFYSSISSTMIEVPFSKIVYEKSKCCRNIADYFLFREFNLEVGRILILVLAILTDSLLWIFIASFFITFFYSVLLPRTKKTVRKIEEVALEKV